MFGHILLSPLTFSDCRFTWVSNRTLDLLSESNEALLVTIPRKLIAVRVFFAADLLEQVVAALLA